MISVYSYSSYRKFLADYLKEQKAFTKSFNQVKLAKKLGLSPSSLKMIQSGARNLTVHQIHNFASCLGLNPQEHEFFESLVHHEQAEGVAEKRFYKRKLSSAAGTSAKSTRLQFQDMLREWFIPAVLIHVIDNEGSVDFALVAKRLGISEARVAETIENLKKLGVLEVHKSQKIHFVMDKFAPHFSKQIYMKKMIPVLQARIERDFHSTTNYFESHTLSLSEAQFRSWLEDYKSLLERYMAQTVEDKTSVYQILVAAFPVI